MRNFKFSRSYFLFSREEQKNSSDLSFYSSEVSFDSSEVSFDCSEVSFDCSEVFSDCSEVSPLKIKKRSLIEGESQDEVDSNGNGKMPLDRVADSGVVVVALVATVYAVAVPRSNDS